MVQNIFISISYTIPLETCKEGSVAIQCCCFQLCAYHCHAPPTPRRARVGIIGDLQEHLTNSRPLGTILCCKSPTFCIGIPKTMKILGQMPQPWGQIMLTNSYKSPPIARPGVGGVDNDRCIIVGTFQFKNLNNNLSGLNL